MGRAALLVPLTEAQQSLVRDLPCPPHPLTGALGHAQPVPPHTLTPSFPQVAQAVDAPPTNLSQTSLPLICRLKLLHLSAVHPRSRHSFGGPTCLHPSPSPLSHPFALSPRSPLCRPSLFTSLSIIPPSTSLPPLNPIVSSRPGSPFAAHARPGSAQEPLVEADFNPTPEALALLSKRDADGAKVSRFLPNPDEWGPGSKATCHAEGASSSSTPTAAMAASALPGTEAGAIDSRGAMLEKRARNQNKRARKRQAREGAGGEQPADAVDAEGPQE